MRKISCIILIKDKVQTVTRDNWRLLIRTWKINRTIETTLIIEHEVQYPFNFKRVILV